MDIRSLRTYIAPLIRWWWLILAAMLLAAVSAFIFGRFQRPIYQAHTTIMVGTSIQDPNPDSLQLGLAQSLTRTYANMVKRDSVRLATMKALGIEWLPDYLVIATPESALIEIIVADTDPQRAQAVAGELANQLVLMSPAGQEAHTREEFVREQLAKLQTHITDTDTEIAQIKDDLADALSASKIRLIEDQKQALEAKAASLQANYAALLSSTQQGAVNTVNIMEPAQLPDKPIDTGKTRLILVAAILGAMVAASGIYLIEFLDDSVRTVEQLHDQFGLTTLSTVPFLPDNEYARRGLLMLHDQHGGAAEALRVLRTNLQFAAVDHPLAILQVTSPTSGDGKSLIAANLAVALAQAGRRVVLIDADLRRPTQHRIFGLINNVGVTNTLVGDVKAAAEFLQPTLVPNLFVLTSGPLPPNPSEMLASRRMQELLQTLKSSCDVVVVDSPPVTAVSDAAVVASTADGVLLVVRAGKTRGDAVKHAVLALQQVRANILGVAFNGVMDRSHGYHYAYDAQYGYGHYRQEAFAAKGARKKAKAKDGNAPKVEAGETRKSGDGRATTASAQPDAHTGGR